MMKQMIRWISVCTLVLATVSMATAQSVPTPVVRMGDWVEVGNEVFMNIIAAADIRYVTTQNYDFESGIRDRPLTRNPVASSIWEGPLDGLQAELRFGGDFRYQKNLQMQVLFETQSIFDGNLIDDRGNSSNPGQATSSTGLDCWSCHGRQ